MHRFACLIKPRVVLSSIKVFISLYRRSENLLQNIIYLLFNQEKPVHCLFHNYYKILKIYSTINILVNCYSD